VRACIDRRGLMKVPSSMAGLANPVAKAVLKAMRVVSSGEGRAAVALPDDENHRDEIARVAEALRNADIGVFWVSAVGEVRLDAPWVL
jgi:hypothetical protein